MMHEAWSNIEEVPDRFSRSFVKFQGHTGQKMPILTRIERFRTELRFELTNGFEMMLEAWCSIEEVPYYFSRSSIKFQGHTGWKVHGLDQIWASLLGRSQLRFALLNIS